jgi:hypothetical protein
MQAALNQMNLPLSLPTMTPLQIPPESDEIEIALLGAGFGECIVVHTGQGEWHIIDSCRFKGIQDPGGLHYLKQMNIVPEQAVKTIVATHWDDDHIRGIGDIVTCCTNAKFVMSAALNDHKFFKIVVDPDSPLYQLITLGQTASTGINEFSKILHHLKEHNKKAKYAIQDRCIWKSELQSNIQIIALSPHDQVFGQAIQSIVSQIPVDGKPIVNIKGLRPNFTSVVLWFRIGEERILLGADMEEDTVYKGWSVIVDNKISIDKKASIYKVAHHGSSTGEHDGIWSDLLKSNPTCLISPWVRGGHILPKQSDLARLSGRSNDIYISYNPESQKKLKAETKHVKRAMEQINARPLLQTFGIVRLRKKAGQAEWRYERFGTAYKLNSASSAT